MSGGERAGIAGRSGCCAALAAVIAAAVALAAPAGASAAPCPVVPATESTTWLAAASGDFNDGANWSNGTPTGSCHASIVVPGTYTVTASAGANMKSLAIGAATGKQTLVISAAGPNTNLDAQPEGITIGANAEVVLDCPGGGCSGGPSGGASLVGGPSPLANEGKITVASTSGTGPSISGTPILNTGEINVNQNVHVGGVLENKAPFNIANGKTATLSASSCGDTGPKVKNEAGGSINATGSGRFNMTNYVQGDGATTGAEPIQIPCGSVAYTGGGNSMVSAYGGVNLTGALQENQTLEISAASANTIVSLQGDFSSNGFIGLNCPVGGCNGGPSGGAGFNLNGHAFDNSGIFEIAPGSGTGAGISNGTTTNTGFIRYAQSGALGGVVVNEGTIEVADGKQATSSGSSCGDTGPRVKNEAEGAIVGVGSGTLSVVNYEQGDGITSGTLPVQIPCGSLTYTGNGAGVVQANGGITLSGANHFGQTLVLNGASNGSGATLAGDFTNRSLITLTCPTTGEKCFGAGGGSGGGAGFNANDHAFTNAGLFIVAAASGTGAGVSGGLTNIGTMTFEQSATMNGVIVNKGAIDIADGKTVTNPAESCGNTAPRVKNEAGGQINATGSGSGQLSVINYEQGAGTTSGTAPVFIPCGSLTYTGDGESTITVGGASMTGNVSAGQTLRIPGTVNAAPFSNAGTIVLDQLSADPSLNVGGTLTNIGTIATFGPSAHAASLGGSTAVVQSGASAQTILEHGTRLNLANPLVLNGGSLRGGGTVGGSVENLGGTVAPEAFPPGLTVNGNYAQGPGGTLSVGIEGPAPSEFGALSVGGNANLDGTLAMMPSAAFASTAKAGGGAFVLGYGGARTGQFAATTSTPSLACPNVFTAEYDDGAKSVHAVVSGGGTPCKEPEPEPKPKPEPPKPPDTKIGAHPKAKLKTKKKVKVKFTFSSDVAGATFQCKLDRAAYAPCSSPKSFTVKPGKHTFSVKTVNGGTEDPTPATYSFRVVKKKPKKH